MTPPALHKNIGNHKNFVPTLLQKQIGFGSSRTVRAFGQNAAFNFVGVLAVDHAIDRARHEDVARHESTFPLDRRGQPHGTHADFPFFKTCCSAASTSMPFGL